MAAPGKSKFGVGEGAGVVYVRVLATQRLHRYGCSSPRALDERNGFCIGGASRPLGRSRQISTMAAISGRPLVDSFAANAAVDVADGVAAKMNEYVDNSRDGLSNR